MNTEQRPDETPASPADEAKPSHSPESPEIKHADEGAPALAKAVPPDVPTQPEGLAAHERDADDDGDEGEGGEGEAGEGEGTAEAGGAGATGEGGAAQTGEKKKRRQRRRRKKKDGAVALGPDGQPLPVPEGGAPLGEGGTEASGDAAVAGATGAAPGAEGGDRAKKQHERREKRKDRPHHHEERERPAFNHGDVVFGKVIDFNEDVIFIDLSGKAKAIFDLRELLITEEEDAHVPPEEEDEEEAHADHADHANGEAAHAEHGDHAASEHAEGAHAEAATPEISEPAEEAGVDAPHDLSGQTSDVGAEPKADAAPVAQATADASLDVKTEKTEPTRRIVRAAALSVEPATAEAKPEAAATAEGATAEATAAAEGAAPAEENAVEEPKKADAPAPQPQLPRVIMEPGAPFVGVVHNDGGRGGLVVLTHHPKRVSRSKPIVSAAFREKTMVWGIVTGVIKGGVEVDVDGLRAFAPGSHMDLRMGADLHPLIGKRLPFAVTQYGKRGHNVVLSRRSILEESAKELREEALKKLEIGGVMEGVVRTVVQFGAFIDIGGVEGLVPLSEMSHNRADTPKDVFKVGDKVSVKVLRVDEKGKLWLSRRAAIQDPWSAVSSKYSPGTKHTGKVARLQPFGAFIELEPGVDGLIHTADLSIKRIEHPSEVLKVGDPIDVFVASVDPSHHRIGLHPAPAGDAAGEAPQRVQIHKVVKVQVVAIEANGLVVRVLGATGRHARGFITASGTGTPKGAELRKLFPIGKELDAKVTEMDPRRSDIRLSLKAVNEDNERNAYQQYRAQVKREAKFGTFADLLKKVNVPNKE